MSTEPDPGISGWSSITGRTENMLAASLFSNENLTLYVIQKLYEKVKNCVRANYYTNKTNSIMSAFIYVIFCCFFFFIKAYL